jgi:DNA-binding transcriptional regulator YhcF (GntR family)
MIRVRIDTRAPIPPYEQLRSRIASSIATGDLAPRHRLPSVRQLARDLGVAPNTVVRAYRELVDEGLITMKGRTGAFVVGPSARAAPDQLKETARAFGEEALRRGIGREAAIDELSRVLAEVYGPDTSTSLG